MINSIWELLNLLKEISNIFKADVVIKKVLGWNLNYYSDIFTSMSSLMVSVTFN
jgi:hypothetical protein